MSLITPWDSGEFLRQRVLAEHAPAAVLVDESGECLELLGPTDRWFRAVGQPTRSIAAMARDGVSTPLRAALEEAARTNRAARRSGLMPRDGEGLRRFEVTATPTPASGRRLFTVVLTSLEVLPSPEESDDPMARALRELEIAFGEVRADLGDARRDLVRMLQDRDAARAELHVVKEEAQASNEEMLAVQEELQSVNEELSTVNAQLEETLARERETAENLRSILLSVETATLYLDRDLRLRFFTPSVGALFNVRTADIGRPLADLAPKSADDGLLADAAAVLEDGERRTADVEASGGAWFARVVRSFRMRDESVAGVVITYEDITGRKRNEIELSAARESAAIARDRLAAAIEALPDAFALFDRDDRLEPPRLHRRGFLSSLQATSPTGSARSKWRRSASAGGM